MKFRVWNKIEKRWVHELNYFLSSIGKIFVNNPINGLINCKQENYIIQFNSGRDDDNEKELFEGDIVSIIYDGMLHRGNYIGIIEENENFVGYHILIQEVGVSLFIRDEDIESIIKIGNEFENPELLMK